ncbi:hypothetical protein BJ742DRAFT_814335 [Cladochytrium replicatum]|nr:hypothetical protein BJ742DRAFT_814335 [Cladochytrium replicatum]
MHPDGSNDLVADPALADQNPQLSKFNYKFDGLHFLITDDGGIKKRVIKKGSGPVIDSGWDVKAHYTGFIASSGEKFDSSLDRGRPFEFTVGKGSVIEAWDKGFRGMQVGESAELIATAQYAYGEIGNLPLIPPGATLRFEVEVLSADPPEDPIPIKLADAKSLKDSGNALFKSSNFPEALEKYRKALSRLENTWGAEIYDEIEIRKLKITLYNNVAACCIKTKDMADAIVAADKCVVLEHDNVKAWFRKGQALAGLARFGEAIVSLQKAAELDPSDSSIKTEIGRVKKAEVDLKQREKKMYTQMFS